MSAQARANGWRGFNGIGKKVEAAGYGYGGQSGWLYRCDGMPTLVGCGEELIITRRFVRVGVKSTGWLVCYGRDDGEGDDGKGNDLDVVLTFCPACRVVVEAQERAS